MEEKKTIQPLKADTKKVKTSEQPVITPEQVQGIVQQAEIKLRQMSEQLRQMNQMLTDKTIEELFMVIKHASYFEPDFVDKCTKCIETYITNVAFSSPEQPEEQKKKEE